MVFFYNYFFKKTNNYFTINNLNQIFKINTIKLTSI